MFLNRFIMLKFKIILKNKKILSFTIRVLRVLEGARMLEVFGVTILKKISSMASVS